MAAPLGEVQPASRIEPGTTPLEGTFATIGAPRAFRSLGGLSAWWRITVHGPQGETIGIREITHFADPSVPDRDRLEFADGRVCGRLGAMVFAERHGLPWPTLVEASAQDLTLFGLHLRMPWVLTDRQLYAEAGSEQVTRAAEVLTRIRWLQRTQGVSAGPEPEPRQPVDLCELWTSAKGEPLELVHEFASSRQRRTVRFEDWRAVGSVRMPFRRVYVDASGRPTTTLELLRVEVGQPVSDRDFRLH